MREPNRESGDADMPASLVKSGAAPAAVISIEIETINPLPFMEGREFLERKPEDLPDKYCLIRHFGEKVSEYPTYSS